MIASATLSLLLIGKIFALIALVIYIVFALVVIKQVNLMIGTLDIGFNAFIRFMAWAHLVFAIFVLITAFLIL